MADSFKTAWVFGRSVTICSVCINREVVAQNGLISSDDHHQNFTAGRYIVSTFVLKNIGHLCNFWRAVFALSNPCICVFVCKYMICLHVFIILSLFYTYLLWDVWQGRTHDDTGSNRQSKTTSTKLMMLITINDRILKVLSLTCPTWFLQLPFNGFTSHW